MRYKLFLLCLFVASELQAQINYDVNLIPKDILPYASAVVRNETITTEVKTLDDVAYHVKKAITVLNKNGEDIAHMAIFYDKNTSIKYIKGVVYNEFGKIINKFAEKDFLDQSAINDFSLFEDERVKHYIPAITEFPYTIEYEYEVKDKQTLNFHDWTPITDNNEAVESSTFQFICKPDFKIRYKEINIPEKASEFTNDKGLKVFIWQVKNMKATRAEPFSPNWHVNLPRLTIAPEKFFYAGVTGSFNNWQEMGKWMSNKLLLNRDKLPLETIAAISDLIKGITDPKQKARKIYEYMQQKTHYVSVQVGIGGYQPFLASDVDHLNYGDCKALVNYTQALLKVADIDSYYCIVYGNHYEKINLFTDFASMQGNHAILCIPFKNDTTWAECTSQTIPFGFLSDFTDDRTVLACTPQGGKLMHTPIYPAQHNVESRKANFVINDHGELSGSMTTTFKGIQYEERQEVIDEAAMDRVKEIKKIYPINNLEVEKLEYKQEKSADPVTIENIKLQARDYGSIDGAKIYFMANPVNRITKGPSRLKNRINDIEINHGYTEQDEVTYTLPPGYHLAIKELDVNISKPFGTFSAKSVLVGNQLTYKRSFVLRDGEYSKDKYPDLLDFFSDIIDADDYTVSLVKN